jgi:chorismate-pyruvate lyase
MAWGTSRRFQLFAAAAAIAACLPAYSQELPRWPDTYVARLQALALVETLNAEVLASRSATTTLETWCREHQLANEPAIVAELVKGAVKPPTAEQRQRLQVPPETTVRFRRVRLRCGKRVLAETDNWYVPDRLTADMNRLLDTTDTPLGKVVRPLEPYRQTFAVKLLWSPSRRVGSAVQLRRRWGPAGHLRFPRRSSSTKLFYTLGTTSRSPR